MRRRDLPSVVPQSGTKEDASFCFYETGVTGVCLLVANCFRTYVPSAVLKHYVPAGVFLIFPLKISSSKKDQVQKKDWSRTDRFSFRPM